MTRLVFWIVAIGVTVFILSAIVFSAIAIARCERRNVSPAKKQICSKCSTGKNSYLLDRSSESCPYISCLKNGKCAFFRPIKKFSP